MVTTCALNFYHGSGHWRWSASVGFSGCGCFLALSDSCSPQARGLPAGRSSGYHRGQLWTGQRSASFLLFSLRVVSTLISQSKYNVQEVSPEHLRSAVFVLTGNKKACSLFCRVRKNIPCCRCSTRAVWARCSPPTAGGAGADSKSNRIPSGGWIIVSRLKWSCGLLLPFWLWGSENSSTLFKFMNKEWNSWLCWEVNAPLSCVDPDLRSQHCCVWPSWQTHSGQSRRGDPEMLWPRGRPHQQCGDKFPRWHIGYPHFSPSGCYGN